MNRALVRDQKSAGRRTGERAVGLVEFALTAPVVVALIFGLILLGVVVMNQVQLTNAVRDGARAAAVCGGVARYQRNPVPTLPDGTTSCSSSNLLAYINSKLQAVPGGATLSVSVQFGSAIPDDPNVLDECQKGKTVTVEATYPQPLYISAVGWFFGDHGSATRTLHAQAEATCEI